MGDKNIEEKIAYVSTVLFPEGDKHCMAKVPMEESRYTYWEFGIDSKEREFSEQSVLLSETVIVKLYNAFKKHEL